MPTAPAEVVVGRRIWGTRRRIDVVMKHPETRLSLGLECKFQKTSGTAEEKIPAVIDDIAAWPIRGIVVFSGDGFSANMVSYLHSTGVAVELGDLRIVDLTLRVLAGETFMTFSEPNREKIKEMKIESKIGELTAEKLGNANFEYAEIDGNIGELIVDFSADFEPKYDRDVDMSLNIGQTRLYFPRDDAFRFSVSKFLFFSDVEVPRYFYKEGK